MRDVSRYGTSGRLLVKEVWEAVAKPTTTQVQKASFETI